MSKPWYVLVHDDGDFGYFTIALTEDPNRWIEDNKDQLPRSGSLLVAQVEKTYRIDAEVKLVPIE